MNKINLVMKRLAFWGSFASYFILAKNVFAQTEIKISPPPQGYSDLGAFVTNVFTLAFGVAILVVLVMLIWGAFEWITSGGDKEAVGKARNRIINALIGLAVLAVAFALARVAAQFLGFDIFAIPIPTPPCLPPRSINPATGVCT